MKKLFLAISCLFFACCTNSLDEEVVLSSSSVAMDSSVSSDFLTRENLSPAEVEFVARTFSPDVLGASTQAESRSSRSSRQVKEAFPLISEGGRPLAYAVNFTDGGYVIVSATQKYSPVIGFSETGSLPRDCESSNPGLSFWLDYIKQDMMIQAGKEDESDSTVVNIRLQWSEYVSEAASQYYSSTSRATVKNHLYWYTQARNAAMMSNFTDPSRMMSEDLDRYNELMLKDYGSHNKLTKGEIGDLQMKNKALKAAYVQIGAIATNVAAYFWTEYMKGYDEYKQEEFVTTKWHQNYPFNLDNPPKTNGEAGNQPAGCVTIAVAQLLNYYKYPDRLVRMVYGDPYLHSYDIDWSKITDVALNGNTYNVYIPPFIRFVNQGLHTENGDSGSSSTISHAQVFLNLNGYGVVRYDGLNFGKIVSELKAKRPVYMQGVNAKGEAHAFLCTGYGVIEKRVAVELKMTNSLEVKEYQTNPYSLYRTAFGKSKMTNEYFAFNLGWGENGNWIMKPINGNMDINGFNSSIKTLIVHKP